MAEDKSFQTNDLLNYYLTMNMNNICRVCLEKGKLMPIFDPVKPPHFSILIMACAQVQVQEGDGLPPYICYKCVSKLNIAFQFKTQCESADARLRNCFESSVQQLSQEQIHISNTQYISEVQDDSELSNSSISITFTSNGGGLNNNTSDIQLGVNGISETSHIQSSDVLTPGTVENNLGNLPNVTTLLELEKVTLTELKLDFNDLRQNDLNIKVEELNLLNLDGISQVKNTKPKKVDQHQCGTCGKIFRAKPSLVHHIRIHTGERPYICHLCDKRFINGGHLHTHMKTHTGEKNHVCAACHKAFTTAQQLTKHTIAVHTSERPYGCTYCTKRFASSSNLRTHTRIHTGEKNFRCDQCGKAFCTKGQLEQHMLTHTGEKAFLCEYCNKRFSQKCHLLRHWKTHRVS